MHDKCCVLLHQQKLLCTWLLISPGRYESVECSLTLARAIVNSRSCLSDTRGFSSAREPRQEPRVVEGR